MELTAGAMCMMFASKLQGLQSGLQRVLGSEWVLQGSMLARVALTFLTAERVPMDGH